MFHKIIHACLLACVFNADAMQAFGTTDHICFKIRELACRRYAGASALQTRTRISVAVVLTSDTVK
jgi:hypothetical protein